MLKKRDKSVVLLLQVTLENQQRLKLLEQKIKRLERYLSLTLRIILGLIVFLSQIAK